MTSVEPAVKYFLLKITKSVMKGKHLNSWVTTSVPIQSSSIVTKVQSKHHRSCTTITAPVEKKYSHHAVILSQAYTLYVIKEDWETTI